MTDATPEQLARKIAQDCLARTRHAGKTTQKADIILQAAYMGALAAIIETTERAAKLAESSFPVIQCVSVEPIINALQSQADALRNQEHLKND